MRQNQEAISYPDWQDMAVVYNRMKAHNLFDRRIPPDSVAGYVMTVALFTRAMLREPDAQRYSTPRECLDVVIDWVCQRKGWNRGDFLASVRRWLHDLRWLDTDPMPLMEALGAA